MFEMGLTELDGGRRASLRARSHSEDGLGLGGATTEEDEGLDEGVDADRYGHHRGCCDHASFEEILRLSDFLHISETGLSEGSSGSADEWDQDKMNKLRVQVSPKQSDSSMDLDPMISDYSRPT